MSVLLMLFWDRPATSAAADLAPDDLARLRAVLGALPGLRSALIFTPAQAQDIYTDDGASPPLGLQLEFADLAALEQAAAPDGGLQPLFGSQAPGDLIPQGAGAFLSRSFPVADPHHPPQSRPCSFVVHYPGRAADANVWLSCYIEGHPPLMRRLPGIRAIEILTPVDWVNHLPLPKAQYMLRNRVLFDSPEALTAALRSPVRHELRDEFDRMPAFEGGSIHHAMLTETFRP